MKNLDIHNETRRKELVLDKLKKAKGVSDNNKSLIKEFSVICSANGLTSSRIRKYVYTLTKIAKWLKKDFDKANKSDIVKLIQKIEKEDYTDWTKHDYKVVTKRFYKWLKGNDEVYPDEVRWIKPRIKSGSHKLPKELLTEDEIKRMVDSADHIRDKALILMLYESGCRIGEIASLRIKDVQFDKYGAVTVVSGKTGDRRVRLIGSAPLLSNWIDNHPTKDDSESPLWVSIGTRNKNKLISYNNISMRIKDIAKKAGIKKNVHPHLFRHSRATYLAKHLTEAQMKQIFGWVQSSDMAAVYVHLSGRDTDDAILKLNGVVDEEREKPESKLKPKNCPRCKFVNSATSKFCQKCGVVLDIKTAMELDTRRDLIRQIDGERKKLIKELIKEPEFEKVVMKELKEYINSKEIVKITAQNM
ncbi:MAG: tyrosine-type recombinase/integrase [Candidatus Aenigmarchaeota archaeon]|nr:tyrosine-type recombinase/integrase [Candidatus Aenigmarchaeota archaeon]